MEQLPGSDAVFLSMDTDTIYAHVGALTVLDLAEGIPIALEELKRRAGLA